MNYSGLPGVPLADNLDADMLLKVMGAVGVVITAVVALLVGGASGSSSSVVNTSGSSAQNAGPMALPLPGPINVTRATRSEMSTVTDS